MPPQRREQCVFAQTGNGVILPLIDARPDPPVLRADANHLLDLVGTEVGEAKSLEPAGDERRVHCFAGLFEGRRPVGHMQVLHMYLAAVERVPCSVVGG